MSERTLKLRDSVSQDDCISNSLIQKIKHPSPYVKTRVICKDEFGRVIFEEENQVVLGGSLFTVEKVWGLNSPLTIETLNNIMSIATSGPLVTSNKDTFVCLFGVGTGGAGDTIKSVKDVKYYEREVFDMVPLRIPQDPLSSDDQKKYFFRRQLENSRTAHYLKKFETTPTINVLWKDGPEGEDGTMVEEGVHGTSRTENIETFVEMHLKISKNDVKEYFEMNGNIDETRINSIGLFTGVISDIGEGKTDYKQVKLFSKLNIPNEALTLRKDMDIYYRVYVS